MRIDDSNSPAATLPRMDLALLGSLVAFAFAALMTPGPNNLLLMSSGALFGFRATLPHVIGIQLGFVTVMTSAVLGLGALVEAWPGLLLVVKIGGAAWLAWMALRFLRAALASRGDARPVGPESATLGRPFRLHEAVLFQWVNPKGVLVAISTAAAYVEIAESAAARAITIGGVFLVMGSLSSTTWATLGSALHRFMSEGSVALAVNATMSGLLLATAATILLA